MAKETIKFEHIDRHGDGTPLPDGYDGFHWDNVSAYNAKDSTSTGGYEIGVHSGNSDAYNPYGYDASFSSDTSFTLKTAYLTSAFYPEQVTFTAFAGGIKVGHRTFTIDNVHQTFVHFGHHFRHIDSVSFTTGNAAATQVVIDDLKVAFDGAIPAFTPHHDLAALHDLFAPHVAHVLDMHAHDFSPVHHGVDAWMFC